MEEEHRKLVAKKVAALLAESGATMEDVPCIFKRVKRCLTVTLRPKRKRRGYSFGIYVPPKYTEDGDRIWHE